MSNENRLTPTCTVVDFDAITPVPCPCGIARRALDGVAELPITVHRTEIKADARVHYHRTLTETYYILECDAGAAIELNGERIALRRGMCVVIPPGVRHRAVGPMTILNIVYPKFDPADEWFDELGVSSGSTTEPPRRTAQ